MEIYYQPMNIRGPRNNKGKKTISLNVDADEFLPRMKPDVEEERVDIRGQLEKVYNGVISKRILLVARRMREILQVRKMKEIL